MRFLEAKTAENGKNSAKIRLNPPARRSGWDPPCWRLPTGSCSRKECCGSKWNNSAGRKAQGKGQWLQKT